MIFLLFHFQYQEENLIKGVLRIAQGTNVSPTLARACREVGGVPKPDTTVVSTRDFFFH